MLELRLPDVPNIPWNTYGELVAVEEGKVTLRVPRERIPEVSAQFFCSSLKSMI
ncbi:hypothetical protein GCM10020331_071310 [Ectobacillus funiculus]